MSVLLLQADARSIPVADETIQCVVTSPPYYGLRSYEGEQVRPWGGDSDCKHQLEEYVITKGGGNQNSTLGDSGEYQVGGSRFKSTSNRCTRCGAWFGGYGLEPTIEMYVDHSIEILREIRRVLRKDGVVFWNVGDSYAGSGTMGSGGSYGSPKQASVRGSYFATNQKRNFGTVKPKDLCLIPARVAIAAQDDGWWVRSLIIWAKPNPMPESVTDRPTDAYEHILMLTKSEIYFWDGEAVREPAVAGWNGSSFTDERDKIVYRNLGNGPRRDPSSARINGNYPGRGDAGRSCNLPGQTTRNIRNVWEFPTQPFPEAHFATFPEELPRRCILAATSAKGACAQCGAPWERVVKAEGGTIGQDWNSNPERGEMDYEIGHRTKNAMKEADRDGTYQRRTVGWRPTCLCKGQHGKTVPSRVLDPFGGSGTTGRVAVELNREAILLDLHYHEIAERRTRNVQRRLL